MKANIFTDGLAVISLVTAGLIATTSARLPAHGHQHGDVFDRIMHKPTASAGSSLNITYVEATDSSAVICPTPTETAIGTGCFGPSHDTPSSKTQPELYAYTPPMPQVQVQTFDRRQYPSAMVRSRRRQHHGSAYTFGEGTAPATLELGPYPTGTPLTEPEAIISTATISPMSADIEDDDVVSNVSGKHAETYFSPEFDATNSHHAVSALAPRQDDSYQSLVLRGFSSPTSSSTATSATATSLCPGGNGTSYTSAAEIDYQIICNVDFVDNDFPFQMVDSFAGCVEKCDAWNYDNHHIQCLAALFIPSREGDADDCYLKSSIANPTVATLQIEGVIRVQSGGSSSSSSSLVSSSASTPLVAASSPTSIISSILSSLSKPSSSALAPPSAPSVSSPGVTYALGNSVITPKVAGSHLQGPTQNTPSKQYLAIEAPASITLSPSLLTVGVNGDLTTGYDISLETGVLEVNISTQSYLSLLSQTPHLSRDGGRGGTINGQHLFIFCDTGSYSTPSATSNGDFLGFVSSSVAVDIGMNGLSGDVLALQDGIGEWSDNVGRMRGFAPLTEGEVAYNNAMQGKGQRYAVWPESSIIPLDATTGLIYAPIVYDNVNEVTKAAVFTYTGTALLSITAGGKSGPIAQRAVDKMFDQDEVEWGCAGGIRSWGPSGIGGNDGSVYLFGNIAGGLLLARTSAANVADRNSFEYWNGNSWSGEMQTSISTAFFIKGAFMDIDIFYSPRHLTFIIVYMTIYADSTFYYRYLEADQAILPPFVPGGDSSTDYVENILKYSWSEEQILYKAAPGLSGKYIYSGGPHLGYYGSDDIINGGTKMLLSWTAPTGLDPSTLTSEYQIPTVEIDWA